MYKGIDVMNTTTIAALSIDRHGKDQQMTIYNGPASTALHKRQRSELSMKRLRSIDNGIWNLEPDATIPTFELSKMSIDATTTHDDSFKSRNRSRRRIRSASPERKRLRGGLKRTAKFLKLADSAPALLCQQTSLDGGRNAIWGDPNSDGKQGWGSKKVKVDLDTAVNVLFS